MIDCGPLKQRAIIQPGKGIESIDVCGKVDEPPRHSAKWKRPDIKGDMSYDTMYMKYSQ